MGLQAGLKEKLDCLYNGLDINERIASDPVVFPGRFKNPIDIETAGLIASSFAYGNVKCFKRVLDKLFGIMGDSPADFCSCFSINKDMKRIHGIKYRFNTEWDIAALLYLIGKAINEYGSLAGIFYHFDDRSEDIKQGLAGFVNYFLSIDPSPVYEDKKQPINVKQFFPSPSNGGACKRLNLFLRWMVRDDEIDFGIWDLVSPSRLIIPLDTHIRSIAYRLGLTTRRSSSWLTAKEITDNLKTLDPDDPVKYDFALCHHGISGNCRPGMSDSHFCCACVLKDVCKY